MKHDLAPVRTVTIVGQAREQHGKMWNDRFRLCLMEVAEPYPHVVYFTIEARDGCGISSIVGEMEDAEEVSIEFDLRETSTGFEDVDPALSTSPGRITITRPGTGTDDPKID